MTVCVTVCLSACISKNIHSNFLYMLPVAVAQFSLTAMYFRYVLLVYWTMLRFHVIEWMGQNQRRRVFLVQFARWQHQLDVIERCLIEFARWWHQGCSLLSTSSASCYVLISQNYAYILLKSICGIQVCSCRQQLCPRCRHLVNSTKNNVMLEFG